MDFRLKVFVVTASTLNYSNTAKLLRISQPAVTQNIQALEKEYGLQLFMRKGNRLLLTHHGQLFLPAAKEVLRKYKELENLSKLLASAAKGNYTIGVPYSLYHGIFPSLIADYSYISPEAQFTAKILANKDIEAGVKDSSLSAGFVWSTSPGPSSLFTDTLLAVSNGMASIASSISLNEAKVILHEGDTSTQQQLADYLAACGRKVSDIHIATTLKDIDSVIKFLLSYNGKASLPVVAFLWRSQVFKAVAEGRLAKVNITELEDITPPVRYYSLVEAANMAGSGFTAFLRAWSERLA